MAEAPSTLGRRGAVKPYPNPMFRRLAAAASAALQLRFKSVVAIPATWQILLL